MPETPHMAVVSDIAANHVETLYRGGSRTLPALTDLLEVCQAAVLYDQLALSPLARRRSSLFREFDFVYTPDIEIVDAPAAAAASTGRPAESEILIDADPVRGSFSNSIYGELLLAMAFAETFQDDRVIGVLANVDALPPEGDRGRAFFSKLPHLMLALQHQRGLIAFEDEAARESLDEVIAPMIERYEHYARHVVRLQNLWRVGVVSSVLEQPIVSALVVDEALADPEPVEAGERARLIKHLDQALLGAPARAQFFEKWRFPPIGMMVLAQAASLDDVPKVVRRARDEFAKLRRAISEIESRLSTLSRDAKGFSAHAEQAARDREELDRKLREAYAAFDTEINRRRQWGRRTELVFNAFDFTLSVAEGIGIGSLAKLVDVIGLKRMAMMQRVPGLLRVASLVRHADSKLVTEVAARLLGRPERLPIHADLLRMAYDHAESYVKHRRDTPPPVTLGLKVSQENAPPFELSDREVWMELVRNEPLRKMLMLSEDPDVASG
jgi:hypothetical protein